MNHTNIYFFRGLLKWLGKELMEYSAGADTLNCVTQTLNKGTRVGHRKLSKCKKVCGGTLKQKGCGL